MRTNAHQSIAITLLQTSGGGCNWVGRKIIALHSLVGFEHLESYFPTRHPLSVQDGLILWRAA